MDEPIGSELTSPGGLCTNCGVWVPNGETHSCSSYGSATGNQGALNISYNDPLIAVLNRIADALEKLVEK